MNEQSFSLDRMLKNMPKFFQLADDMHRLTNYINDMRIIMLLLVVGGIVGGIGFVWFRYRRQVYNNDWKYDQKPPYPDHHQPLNSVDGRNGEKRIGNGVQEA